MISWWIPKIKEGIKTKQPALRTGSIVANEFIRGAIIANWKNEGTDIHVNFKKLNAT